MAPVVRAESLTKRFGSVTAVDDLSFELEPGTITGFLGPNGAGKTTTLRMLLGLAVPTSGRAMVFGTTATPSSISRRSGSAPCWRRRTSTPAARAANHLRMLGRAAGIPDSRVDEVLRLVELDGAADRRVKGYSLGMRQRLGLAAALLGDPELLILDEPANGLDPEGVRWLRDFLRAFAAGGRTVLVSSHVLAEVAQTVDHVLIIAGELVIESPLDELTAGSAAPCACAARMPRLQEALERDGSPPTGRRARSSSGHHHRARGRDRRSRPASCCTSCGGSVLARRDLPRAHLGGRNDRPDPGRDPQDPLDAHHARARRWGWSRSSSCS